MISELKKLFGFKCSVIKIDYEGIFVNTPSKEMPLCEAISYSFNVPLLLNSRNLNCLGSKRSMGLLNNEDQLVKQIHEHSKISPYFIQKTLQHISKFDKPVNNIFLGITEEMESEIRPDLYIIYMEPKDVMELMCLFTERNNKYPFIQSCSFLSVCGNIMVRTYFKDGLNISFGCAESRKHGGVGDNQLIAGLSYEMCKRLFN